MENTPPAARCPVPACPIVYRHGPPRLCSEHADDRAASGAYATGLSQHRSPWRDRQQPSEPEPDPSGRDGAPDPSAPPGGHLS